jgi:hypothetical protein
MDQVKHLASKLLGELPELKKTSQFFHAEAFDDFQKWLQTGTVFVAMQDSYDDTAPFLHDHHYRLPYQVTVVENSENPQADYLSIMVEFENPSRTLMTVFLRTGSQFVVPAVSVLYTPSNPADQRFKAISTAVDFKKQPDVGEAIITEFCRNLVMFDRLANGELSTDYKQEPRFLNKRRARKGKPPLLAHHILKPVPRKTEPAGSMGGTHASPRLHLRRGHYRQYTNGIKRWIKPSWVGDKTRGVVTKTYNLSDGG